MMYGRWMYLVRPTNTSVSEQQPGAVDKNSQPAKEQKNNQDQQNQSKASARVVAPAGAVRPGGQGADQKQQHDNQDDQSHELPLLEQDVRTIAAHASDLS